MNETNPPFSDSDPSALNEPPRPVLKGWILLAGLATISLFAGAVAILYVQWIRYENPNANITLQGDDRFDNATVTITALGGTMREPVVAQFKDGKDHWLRFHLPPGAYNLVVRDPMHRLIFPERPDREFLIDALRPLFIRIQTQPPASTRAR